MTDVIRLSPEVATALRRGHPVVALESSVFAQGLPVPANREAAERMVGAVRALGATPAITAVLNGTPVVGVTDRELERLLERDGVTKVSARDIPLAMAGRLDGATTVAGAIALASLAGIDVFATGGIGGVHREIGERGVGAGAGADGRSGRIGIGGVRDESADLMELARTAIVVVSAGAKSILDLEGTMERLETLGVPLIGYRTSEFPGFFTAETGLPLSVRADTAIEVVAAYRAQRSLGRPQALLVVQPPPASSALRRGDVESVVAEALERARQAGVRGPEMTPYLLGEVERATQGRSVGANLALLEHNAALAAEIACELAGGSQRVRARSAGNRARAGRGKGVGDA